MTRSPKLMPRGKSGYIAIGKSSLCKKGHDLNAHGKWVTNKRTGGMQRRCLICAAAAQKRCRDKA